MSFALINFISIVCLNVTVTWIASNYMQDKVEEVLFSNPFLSVGHSNFHWTNIIGMISINSFVHRGLDDNLPKSAKGIFKINLWV
jgi:hypothetical protein